MTFIYLLYFTFILGCITKQHVCSWQPSWQAVKGGGATRASNKTLFPITGLQLMFSFLLTVTTVFAPQYLRCFSCLTLTLPQPLCTQSAGIGLKKKNVMKCILWFCRITESESKYQPLAEGEKWHNFPSSPQPWERSSN